jgi:signal transduction histidine kinase
MHAVTNSDEAVHRGVGTPTRPRVLCATGYAVSAPIGLSRLTSRIQLETVRSLSITSLQWTVGAFVATIGALMLVSPHQFASLAYVPVSGHLAWLGPGFLVAGAGLLAVALPSPRFRYVVLAHLWAAGMLLTLAGGFALSGSWSGTSNYGVLGLGTALAPLLALGGKDRARAGDAFSLLIGLAATSTGLLLLTMPAQFGAPSYDPIRPYLAWFGLASVATGIALFLSQIGAVVPAWFRRWTPLFAAGPMFVWGFTVALPARGWTGIAYYCGFGIALLTLAWIGPQLGRLNPGSMRPRLALALAAAAAVPVLVLTPLYSHEEESQAIANQFGRQQALALALAQQVGDYITLHQSAVRLLATQPGLLALSPSEQHLLLRSSAAAYTDINGFGVVAADGEPIARSDDRQGTSWIGDPVFEEARRTNQPSLDIRISPVIHRPVFSFGVPVADADGHFGGMVSASLQSSRVADLLSRLEMGVGTRTFLVDATGRVIAHPDADLVASFADLSGDPSVRALLSDPGVSGSLRVMGPTDQLASYAHVPDLAWGVIVEQPTAIALAPTRAKLDLLFAGLLVVIGAAAGFGVLAAGWFSRPLVTLADELRAANLELEALYRVGSTITAALELDVVLNTIAHSTAELLGTDSGAILLVDEATQTLSVKGAYGIGERAVKGTRDRVGESIAGRVVQTGQPIIANDLPNNALFFNPAADQEGLLAVASVPIIVGEMTIGTLDVHSRTDRFAFNSHHIEVLQMLASQAAIALENARLYLELRLARDDLEARVLARTAELSAANAQILALNTGLERRVVERTAELEAANRELEAFSYSVSHDLRAPLRAIHGFSRILLEEHAPDLNAEAQEYLELVRDNAGQMGSLIDDLLRFSRMSRQGLRKDHVVVAGVVRDVLRDLAAEREGRQVEVAIGELRPCHGDAALLKQLFMNLLSNAFKFTRKREIAHIEIGCNPVDGEVVYFVKDDGAGFDMRYANKLFGVFQRLHRAEDFEGTGVGLAIVQRVVQRHGGRIWADGALDRGATFYFTLDAPAQPAEEHSDDTDGNATREAA